MEKRKVRFNRGKTSNQQQLEEKLVKLQEKESALNVQQKKFELTLAQHEQNCKKWDDIAEKIERKLSLVAETPKRHYGSAQAGSASSPQSAHNVQNNVQNAHVQNSQANNINVAINIQPFELSTASGNNNRPRRLGTPNTRTGPVNFGNRELNSPSLQGEKKKKKKKKCFRSPPPLPLSDNHDAHDAHDDGDDDDDDLFDGNPTGCAFFSIDDSPRTKAALESEDPVGYWFDDPGSGAKKTHKAKVLDRVSNVLYVENSNPDDVAGGTTTNGSARHEDDDIYSRSGSSAEDSASNSNDDDDDDDDDDKHSEATEVSMHVVEELQHDDDLLEDLPYGCRTPSAMSASSVSLGSIYQCETPRSMGSLYGDGEEEEEDEDDDKNTPIETNPNAILNMESLAKLNASNNKKIGLGK